MNTSKLLISILFLAACGGDDAVGSLPDAPPAPEPQSRLEVSVGADAKVQILQGTLAPLTVEVTRLDGLTGPVTIAPVGLPPGVTAEPLTIAADQTQGTLVLHAETAPHSLPTPVQIHGTLGGEADDAPATVTVYGGPGALDTSFGGGKVMLPGGAGDDYAYAAAVQADGKVVLGGRAAENLGDFALIRLDRDGNLDPTFGQGGRVLTDFAGRAETIYALAIQPDGKIVAAGKTTGDGSGIDFAVARYTADGTLDATFGTGGKVTNALGADSDTAYAVAIQPDGKIVVAGDSSRGQPGGIDFALARYNPNGSLDVGFGGGGFVTTSIASNGARDSIYALALQGDGKIIAAGGEGDYTIVRYNADGSVDEAFGTGGHVANVFGSIIGTARAVAVDADGTIVVAGHTMHDFSAIRLTPAGALDPAFGTGGKVVTQLSTTNWDEAQGLALDPDGGLIVAGWVFEGGSSAGNFAVVRYDAAGALDPAFGDAGVTITPVAPSPKADQGMAVVLQADPRIPATRIVAAGFASNTNSDFAVARYWR